MTVYVDVEFDLLPTYSINYIVRTCTLQIKVEVVRIRNDRNTIKYDIDNIVLDKLNLMQYLEVFLIISSCKTPIGVAIQKAALFLLPVNSHTRPRAHKRQENVNKIDDQLIESD